jgi:hypothetical protein
MDASPTAFAGLANASNRDPLKMTRELLAPVTELINLQNEMHAAMERLANSLERFATEMITDSLGRATSVEARFRQLETELEHTRERLRDAESLLIATGTGTTSTGAETASSTVPGIDPEADDDAVDGTSQPTSTSVALSSFPDPALMPAQVEEDPTISEWRQDSPPRPGHDAEVGEGLPALDLLSPGSYTHALGQGDGLGPAAAPAPAAGAAYLAGAPQGDPATCPEPSIAAFSLEEVQSTQRHFNDSSFTERLRDVQHSLGRPRANLTRLTGSETRVLVTITWDIVWYQYLVDLSPDPISGEHVSLFREGMDLGDLNDCFKDKNATIDDEGRLDASELEVRLLSDPTVLITELPPEAEKALEDATEEIWDQHAPPEFRWDD